MTLASASAAPAYTGLEVFWFLIIAVLWAGYFVLEGFDFGVGILLPVRRPRHDLDRRVMINTIGPVWDGNEVWLLVAGGATFAAFPNWYATLFSGFYLPLFLILAALIFRGRGLRVPGQAGHARRGGSPGTTPSSGAACCRRCCGASPSPTSCAACRSGRTAHYLGSFFNLLNPYACWAGSPRSLLFALHGSVFLSLKTTGELQAAGPRTAKVLAPAATAAMRRLPGLDLCERPQRPRHRPRAALRADPGHRGGSRRRLAACGRSSRAGPSSPTPSASSAWWRRSS